MASLLSHLSLPKPNLFKASSAPPTAPISLPDSLHHKFGRKGLKFSEVSGVPLLELTVRNGSSLSLRIPDAHLTSYKPKVYWKDQGFEEVLYSLPHDGPDSTAVRGGVGLVMDGISDPLPASEWTVQDVDSDAIDALQVELGCQRGPLDITYVVTLYSESMATAVLVKNMGVKPVTFSNAILSHLKFKRRNGAGIQGLRECSYCSHPPPSSPFQILSPSQAMEVEEPGWFSFGSEPPQKPGSWTVQDVPFTILDKKMSRVYAAPPSERLKPVYNTPPSKYETLDQGLELFFRVIRMGFEDIYVGSPGSSSQKYGKDHFICTGPASILVPLTVEPGEEWRGAQLEPGDPATYMQWLAGKRGLRDEKIKWMQSYAEDQLHAGTNFVSGDPNMVLKDC